LAVERPTLDARHLDALIEHYLQDVDRRSDPKTARGYGHKLRHFREWWRRAGPERGWRLTADDLADFLRYLEGVESVRGGKLAYNTRRDVMRRLRQVFRWARRRGHIPVDLSLDVPMPHGSAPPKRPVELDALAALLEAAGQGNQPIRDRAIIGLLAGTGVRCEEASGVQIRHISIYAGGSGVVFVAKAKNDKSRYVAFDSATGRFLQAQLDALGRDSGPFFPSRKAGRGLSPSGIYKVVAAAADRAGVRDQVRGPHDLRRMFATFWARRLPGKGYGQLLQKQLGHSSFETTATHYLLTDVGDVSDVLGAGDVSPVAQLYGKPRTAKPV